MVGTNIGAGKLARAERIAWTAAALAAGITGCIGLFGVRTTALSEGGLRLIRPRSLDHLFECDIFLALGAADQADLFKVVFRLKHVALFSMPHAVIGPGQSVVGIGGERLVVPIFGFDSLPDVESLYSKSSFPGPGFPENSIQAS
jgi:hypothetical protein